ncbi:MAG: uridine kinase [Clostridia bacterium]|nr:uridine kinase [Clostridia bacterium]
MSPTCQILSFKQADSAIVSRVNALLQSNARVLLAIDGNCCAGKTTLASHLGELLGANVFHLDDYFLQPHMRSPERLSQPGGNVDAERFLADVLLPASRGETAQVQKYDCHADALLAPVFIEPKRVAIIEGAYSLHPLLSSYYDLKIFYRIAPDLQIQRILARNGEEALTVFQQRWIPLENRYFEALDILPQCDLVIDSANE